MTCLFCPRQFTGILHRNIDLSLPTRWVTGILLRNMPVREGSVVSVRDCRYRSPFLSRALSLSQTFSRTEADSGRSLLRQAGVEAPGADCLRREGKEHDTLRGCYEKRPQDAVLEKAMVVSGKPKFSENDYRLFVKMM